MGTKLNGRPARPVPGMGCEVGSHRGLAGHVLLTYPTGGRLLASAGHWVELSRLDVTEEQLLQAAASFGVAFSGEAQASMASCNTPAERQQTIQALSSQMICQSSPCTSSLPPSRVPAPATVPMAQ